MCAIISMLVSGLLPMMDPDHGSVGSKGIVTLTSHLSKLWAMDSWQR
jgi:histidine ammonia-lyase